jgi:general stress protein YciG
MKNPNAVALGKLGGKSRAKKTTPEERKEWARLGGLARAKRHPKSKLSKWAKKGGRPPKKGGNK